MATSFAGPNQETLFNAVTRGLDGLGYRGDLLQREYRFEDWFSARAGQTPELRTIAVAAFGRSPLSYESACFAVALSNGVSGQELISRCRALGAPLAFEIQRDQVLLWQVKENLTDANRPKIFTPREVEKAFQVHAEDWKPGSILRAKNIGPVGPRQTDFIDLGLIPALEENICAKLDPLLRGVFFDALSFYQRRNRLRGRPDWLFRLVFRVLAGKVMVDRRLKGFERFEVAPNAEELLAAVNAHFGDNPNLNADTETRRLVVDRFWQGFSLKNMSVSVLSFVWENTLVDNKVRKELSIHGTPPGVARYIVKRLGFEHIPEDRYIVEPCCGGGTFLLAAMRQLADAMPSEFSARDRHHYLQKRLAGFDIDPFSVEVARDCLMLADYPNNNHWLLREEDVYAAPTNAPAYSECLTRAAVVLCNPPFGKFSAEAFRTYGAQSIHKPIELLSRVLNGMPADAILGFVLPHLVLSGQSYPALRRRLAERFNTLEVVALPDQGVFSSAEYETVLLIAREPRMAKTAVTATTAVNVTHRKVDKRDWEGFYRTGEASREDTQIKKVSEVKATLAVPDLQEVWHYLQGYETVDEATAGAVHRGIEWTIPIRDHKPLLLSDRPKEDYKLGIPPSKKTSFFSFQYPPLKYLCFLPEYRRWRAFELPWERPKVLMNGRRKGRSPWRLAAFADYQGLACFHTFLGLWPVAQWSPPVLAAVLNSPVSNAYIATHAIGRDVPGGVVKKIPVPNLGAGLSRRIEDLVKEYVGIVQDDLLPVQAGRTAERVLLEIDAAVLLGYDLPPRLERRLLDYFNGHGERRPLSHAFGDYFPAQLESYFSLAEYLSEEFRLSTVGEVKRRSKAAPPEVFRALRAATESGGGQPS